MLIIIGGIVSVRRERFTKPSSCEITWSHY